MDPFFKVPTPAPKPHSRWSMEHNSSDPQPQQPTKPSSSGLRRSAGLFNLKLGSPTKLRMLDAHLPSSPTTPTPESLNASGIGLLYASDRGYNSLESVHVPQMPQAPHIPETPQVLPMYQQPPILTPDQSVVVHRKRGNSGTLKRPHPFNNSKPTKHSGFLARSTANKQVTPSAAPSKRPHAEVSFQGARPVQTAFAPVGLMSKRHAISQSPPPRVPETPCKRGPYEEWSYDSDNSQSYSHSHSNSHSNSHSHSHSNSHSHSYLHSHSNSSLLNRTLSESLETVPSRICDDSHDDSHDDYPFQGDDSPLVVHRRAASGLVDMSTPNSAPTDRLQRFSIHNIEEQEPPETPTRFGMDTSTPLARSNLNLNRSGLATVLQSADPSDSLSLCPPESIESALMLNSSLSASLSTSMSDTSTGSPQTPHDRSPTRTMHHPRRMFDLRKSEPAPDKQLLDGDNSPILRVSTPHTPGMGFSTSVPGLPVDSNPNVSTSLSDDLSQIVLFDEHLSQIFDRVQSAQLGEFSAVFVVVRGKQKMACKRTKRPLLSLRERLRLREEVDILNTLRSEGNTDDQPQSHIVQLMDEWEMDGFGYILTEYCENGDLNRFLAAQGRVARLEEWRVWKILTEVLQGLAVVHDHDILHLDLKPANVFVTFEGHLKIGDFGMATRFPVPYGFEREGDREYIAPEVLERQQYSTAADVFSLGIMMVEVAANIVLPDNGVHWQRLRSGDLSDAGKLSSGDLTTSLSSHSQTNPPVWAPRFLVDGSYLLDRIVQEMLAPQPDKRPSARDLLNMPEIELVNARGRAGAVVYEGEYGPEPDEEGEVWQRA